MGNRKSVRPKKGRKHAPRDASESFEDAPASRGARGFWQWSLIALKVTFGLVLLSGAVATLAWGVHRYAQTTPRFAIVELEVEGTKRLAREDVLAAAGLEKGQNLFSLDIPAAEKALVESPWIASARITRRLPGAVRLQVTERDPRALLVLGSKNFLVSQDGVPFKELGSGDPHDFPIITGLTPSALAKDRRAEMERLSAALTLIRDFEKLSLARTLPVQEVHLNATGAVSLVLGEEGTTLHLGLPPFKQKLLRAGRVLSKAKRAGGRPQVVFLDNDAHPERVVVRVQ